jgi:hypothetical protein
MTKGETGVQLKLLDPREDDNIVFSQDAEVYAAPFGMAVPTERMIGALKSFSGYRPPEYEIQQPVRVTDWLQSVLVKQDGVGFGSDFNDTEPICEPVPPKFGIPLSESQSAALQAATSRPLTLIQGPPGEGENNYEGWLLFGLLDLSVDFNTHDSI